MRFRRSLLLSHPAEALFDLVEQAEFYPRFIPWCAGATILERSDDLVTARIEVAYRGMRFDFVTRNPKRRPEWLQVRLAEGPFRRFEGEWRFVALSSRASRLDFELHCEVSAFFGRLATPVFDHVAGTLFEAFMRRADLLPAAPMPVSSSASPPAPQTPAQRPSPEPEPPEPEPIQDHEAPMTQVSPDPATLEALRGSKLAAELSPEQCAALASLMTLRVLRDKEVLVREGSADDHLHVIVDGVLGVIKGAGTPDQVLLQSLHAGDFAGELGFIDGMERYASMVALGEVRVLELQRGKFESLIRTDPETLYRVMRAIVRAVHLVQRRLSMQSTELSNYIYKQHGRY